MSLSRDQINKWLSQKDITNKTCLDIGAGPKEKWACRKTKGKPKSYKTADVDKTFNCNYTFDLNEPINFSEDFDVVFCIEALEHCWNPLRGIKNLSRLTREVCYIATPFINPHHDKWDYFRMTGEWYQKALPWAGFKKVIVTERVATKGKKLLEQFYATEGLRVSKIRPEHGKYTCPIGYCVEARK
jgi:SAM-dependent methyltransferase